MNFHAHSLISFIILFYFFCLSFPSLEPSLYLFLFSFIAPIFLVCVINNNNNNNNNWRAGASQPSGANGAIFPLLASGSEPT